MKRGVLSIVAGLMVVQLYAQKGSFGGYEIGLCGSAGLSALQFTTANGSKPSYSAGYAFGLDIAVLFANQWSFRTGANMASYHASVSFDRLETRNLIATPENLPDDSRFYMETEYIRYEEQHEALYLRFPLMVQYRSSGANSNFYLAAGVQTGIRANTLCRIRSGDVVTKGYSDFTRQYYDELPAHGFATYPDIQSAVNLDFGITLSGVVETGMMWKINNGMALYTGIFLDYGLNDLRKVDSAKESIVYDNDGAHTFNSILHSQNDGKPMTDKVQSLAVGLRLRWTMVFSK